MRRKLPTVLLNENQLHHCVAEWLEEWNKLEDTREGERIDGPGERTAKMQIRQVAKVMGEVLSEQRAWALKHRDACTGKTHKTALQRSYWEGWLDALGRMENYLTFLRQEAGDCLIYLAEECA